MSAKLIIHLSQHAIRRNDFLNEGLYGKVAQFFQAAGTQVAFTQLIEPVAPSHYAMPDFHLMHETNVSAPNVLNTGNSYLPSFWYADPIGVMAHSSITTKHFDPSEIDAKRADAFYARLYQRIVDERISKIPQPKTKIICPKGSIAVFLQGASIHVKRVQHCTEREMIDALLASRGKRPLVIKQHPNRFDFDMAVYLNDLIQQGAPIHLVDANVHDMIEAADITCAISSGVAIQSMLHGTPSVMFGKTDFHHCVETVTNLDDTATALEAALASSYDYKAFMLWLFRRHCLNINTKNFIPRLMERMADRGFDLSSLSQL